MSSRNSGKVTFGFPRSRNGEQICETACQRVTFTSISNRYSSGDRVSIAGGGTSESKIHDPLRCREHFTRQDESQRIMYNSRSVSLDQLFQAKRRIPDALMVTRY